MVRLKNDPVYNLMIRAASSISIESCLPAFIALLSSLDHWRKTELHDTHPYRFVFIQMFKYSGSGQTVLSASARFRQFYKAFYIRGIIQ